MSKIATLGGINVEGIGRSSLDNISFFDNKPNSAIFFDNHNYSGHLVSIEVLEQKKKQKVQILINSIMVST